MLRNPKLNSRLQFFSEFIMQYHQFHLKKSKRELIITINESKFDASAVGEFRNRLSEAWGGGDIGGDNRFFQGRFYRLLRDRSALERSEAAQAERRTRYHIERQATRP